MKLFITHCPPPPPPPPPPTCVCLLFCGMSKVLFTWLILHQFIMCFCKPKDGAKLSQHDGWEIECVDSLMSFNHLANVTHQLWQLILAVEHCFKSQVFDLSQIFHQFRTPLLCGHFPSFDYVPLQEKRLKMEGGGVEVVCWISHTSTVMLIINLLCLYSQNKG